MSIAFKTTKLEENTLLTSNGIHDILVGHLYDDEPDKSLAELEVKILEGQSVIHQAMSQNMAFMCDRESLNVAMANINPGARTSAWVNHIPTGPKAIKLVNFDILKSDENNRFPVVVSVRLLHKGTSLNLTEGTRFHIRALASQLNKDLETVNVIYSRDKELSISNIVSVDYTLSIRD